MDTVRVVSFGGTAIETTVTHKGSTVYSWISGVYYSRNPNQRMIVGLDCEWRPNTTSWMNNPAATLQLCFGTKCLIIQLLYLDFIPQNLINFLGDPHVVFVGVEIARDVEKIMEDHGLECGSFADVRAVAMRRWPYMFHQKPGLKELARTVVGLEMHKPISVTLSNWEARVLDGSQIQYAAIDAYASYRIGQHLL